MIDQPRHWSRGMSGNDRIMACPGCVEEQARWPSEPSGPAAVDGTHSHTLLEACLVNKVRDARCYLGDKLEDHDGKFTVDQDRIDRVNVALNYIWGRMDQLKNATLHVESVVDAGAPYNIPDWKGTADVIITSIVEAEVIDYKDGFKIVQPTSWQPVGYTIGAMNREPHRVFEKIRNTIIQPKDTANPVKFVDYTREEFVSKSRDAIAGMQASMIPGALRVPGDHCKYCSGAKPGRCKAFNERVTMTVNEAFAGVPPAPGAAPIGAAAPSPMPLQLPDINESLSDEKLEAILDASPLVREFLKQAEAEALRRFQTGGAIPNYKVVRGSAQRRWKFDADELAKKFKSMGLVKADYIDEKIKSPSGIEKMEKVKKWTPRKRKNLADLYDKPEGALKVVPKSEKGAPVLFDAKAAFAEVPAPTETQPAADAAPISFL